MKFSNLPEWASWKHIFGVALLAGVGFTMSLFIAGLAFQQEAFIENAKYGILLASVLSGVGGIIYLRRLRGGITES